MAHGLMKIGFLEVLILPENLQREKQEGGKARREGGDREVKRGERKTRRRRKNLFMEQYHLKQKNKYAECGSEQYQRIWGIILNRYIWR